MGTENESELLRSPSYEKKKNSLSFRIGPPSDPPDADKALLLLFSKFYVYLPTPVKERFSRRAAQLEYDPNKTQPHFLMQFIETPRSLFFSGKTALASIMMRVEKCVTNIRLKPSLSRWGGPWVLLEKTLRYRS